MSPRGQPPQEAAIPTADEVRAALKNANDPALNVDFVSAGMVKTVTADGSKVSVDIQLTTPACPHKDAIRAAVDEAVRALPGVADLQVTLSAEVWSRPVNPSNARLPGVKNILAVAAGKGGVGKSTVSTNLAVALSRQGARVGLMDADVYGPSIPQMMGEPSTPPNMEAGERLIPAVHHGIKVISIGFFIERGGAVIWRGPMVHKLLTQFIDDVEWGELDYLIVDLPPGTGDVQLSLSQLLPVTGAVMVTTPQEVSILDVEKAIAMWKKVEVPVLGVIENMSGFVCPSCGHEEEIFSAGGGRRLAEREGLAFLGQVPLHRSITRGGDAGLPVTLAEPQSPLATRFAGLASAVACQLSVRNKPEGTGKRSSRLTVIR